jgi:FlaA1/EpsC-like NDP-sugar epimerase
VQRLHVTSSFPNAGRIAKIVAITLIDCGLVAPAVLIALALRLSDPWNAHFVSDAVPYIAIMTLAAVPLSHALGIPRSLMRMFDTNGLRDLALLAGGLAAVMLGLRFGLGLPLPRSMPGIFFFVYFMALVLVRLGYFAVYERVGGERSKVLIYGAGATGQQLFNALKRDLGLRVVAFVDDSPRMQGVRLGGCRVYPPGEIEAVVARFAVDRVVLAMPSVSERRRAEIAKRLVDLPAEVLTLPPLTELLSGRADPAQLKAVTLDTLLGRKSIRFDMPEVNAAFRAKSVLVTGAGGSIGAELCRQLLDMRPIRLILLDASEFALYEIERELRGMGRDVDIRAVLGSVLDAALLRETIETHGVQVMLHAAAYKHVPLVERNVVEGVRNNVLGTATAAATAREMGLERFILVSTDKAVRPTNVMGASKRMAELVVQDLQRRSGGTIFSLVRFGNVIGSSGSVVPLFREQIRLGGPLTVTHPEMTRYFMTIPEAGQLVLIAGAMSEGGEVFVLDMGEPVRILDLARSMVRLAGRTVREAGEDDGDIEIEITGLRPGEKLHEELLIGTHVLPTPHEKILVAEESMPAPSVVATALDRLSGAIAARDPGAVREVMMQVVEDYDARAEPMRAAE